MSDHPFIVWTTLAMDELAARIVGVGTVLRPLPPGRYVVMAREPAALRAVAGIERVVADPLEHLLPRRD